DWLLAGQEHWLEGNVRDALVAFDWALAEQPDLFWARFLRAIGLQQMKDNTQARAELALCIRDRPDFPWPYLQRAVLHIQIGQLPLAEKALRAAWPLVGDGPAAVRYAWHVNAGYLASERKQTEEAIGEFQKAIDLCPKQPHGYANLARAYWQAGELGRARKL